MNSPDPPDVGVWRFLSTNEDQTDDLGRLLADALEPGTVVALTGNLGSGKTRLVRAVCGALQVDPREVASPTFVLVHEYRGRLPIYHFDTYRLRQPAEFLDLGADEYLNANGVCFIEWADRVAGLLPADHLRVEIVATGATAREFQFKASGPISERVLTQLEGSGGGTAHPVGNC
jgi:tRNA threonylcarbamoyladenosine biosynthesis protein TsaE